MRQGLARNVAVWVMSIALLAVSAAHAGGDEAMYDWDKFVATNNRDDGQRLSAEELADAKRIWDAMADRSINIGGPSDRAADVTGCFVASGWYSATQVVTAENKSDRAVLLIGGRKASRKNWIGQTVSTYAKVTGWYYLKPGESISFDFRQTTSVLGDGTPAYVYVATDPDNEYGRRVRETGVRDPYNDYGRSSAKEPHYSKQGVELSSIPSGGGKPDRLGVRLSSWSFF